MDTRSPPKPTQTVLPPSRPVPVLPTIVDLTKDVKKPRTPETKEVALKPTNIPQPAAAPAQPASPQKAQSPKTPAPAPRAPAQQPKAAHPKDPRPVPTTPTSHQYGNIALKPDPKLAPGYAPQGAVPHDQIHHFNRVVPQYSPYTFIPTGPGVW